jgi:ATP-dependent Clp protease ATP-binding subunit ClpA
MGFVQPPEQPAAGLDVKIERTAKDAARRKFSPEFMNRLDKVVVFHPLKSEQLEEILEIELGMVQRRVLDTAKGQFLFRVTGAGREFLLKEGTDLKYGARHLKRAIERHVVYPLANLLATDQVHLGDVVCIDWDQPQCRLAFTCEAEGAVLPMPTPQPMGMVMAAEAKGGRQVEVPSTIAARDARVAQVAPAPSRRSR